MLVDGSSSKNWTTKTRERRVLQAEAVELPQLVHAGWSGGPDEHRWASRPWPAAAVSMSRLSVHRPDRLTRALSDFTRSFMLFDRHKVSFIPVIQALTTISMGRLVIANMLQHRPDSLGTP